MRNVGQKEPRTSLWLVPRYRQFFCASGLFEFGYQVYRVTLPLIVLNSTKSSLAVNTLVALEYVPNVLFAFFIGAVVDAAPKRLLLVSTLASEVAVVFALMFLLQSPLHQYSSLYALALLGSFFAYAYSNCQAVVMKHVVPPDNIAAAQSAKTGMMTVLAIATPAVSGYLLAFSNYHFSLLLSLAAFIVTGTIAARMGIEFPATATGLSHTGERLRAGWSEFRRNKTLKKLSICVMFSNAAYGVYGISVLLFMAQSLHLNTQAIGFALSTAGVGAVIGSIYATRLRNRVGLGNLMVILTAGLAICYAVFPKATEISMLLVVNGVVGFLMATLNISVWSFRQETTPAAEMGSVAGITGSIFKAGMPVAIFVAGLISRHDPSQAFWVASALSIVCVSILASDARMRAAV